MKIVINDCYGGFGLSHKAVMRYVELKGIKLYPYIDGSFVHYATLPEEERIGFSDKTWYFSPSDIPRDDIVLIQVVEELGKAANGDYASLSVVEIPDDVKWQIEEYDGIEWVAEEHRTWR